MKLPELIDKFRQTCGYRFPRLGRFGFASIIKMLPPVIQTRLLPGIHATLDLRDETQRTTYWFGTRFESPTPQILQNWARESTHFFDIGSNYGFYSFFLYSAFSELTIFAFEPNPKTFHLLSEICSNNHASRVHPQPYGLSDETGRFAFVQDPLNSGHSSFATAASQPTEGDAITECETLRFDGVLERLNLQYPDQPRWIAKIDVEGFELKVLKGMTDALAHQAFRGICIELFPGNLSLAGTTVAEIDAFLRKHGYRGMPFPTSRKSDRAKNHNAFYVPIAAPDGAWIPTANTEGGS